MKILYLLFAVFFLVLQSSPGFTRDPITTVTQCLLAGGFPFLRRCPFPSYPIGTCGMRCICCKRPFME